MNIFYEESGQFKVASVVQKNDSTYQVDTQYGKRMKIKENNVFIQFEGAMHEFLEQAQAEAAEMDTDLLWQVCGAEEFKAQTIAEEYFGHRPNSIELAATLIALYAAPMYFYKKGKGIFKAAPEETLQQALAAIERKKQQEMQMQAWQAQLEQGVMPSEMLADLKTILHAPDKQSLTYKAFNKAAETLKLSPYELAKKTGAIQSLPQYLHDGFEMQYFPKGIDFPEIIVPTLPDLPLAQGVRAFSIDDESTTEIDDALSLQDLGEGRKRVGIHIAAPALGVLPHSEMEKIIFARQSTAYFPGGKITMLPENWIAAFSLDEGDVRPAMSIYFDVDQAWQVSNPQTQIERVWIEKNLRIQAIEPHFNGENGSEGGDAFAHHHDLAWLLKLAIELQKQRGKYEPDRVAQFDYGIELRADGIVEISKRERGSPIDTLVSEMMILANSTWAKMLDENGLAGLFRVQPALGKVRMSSKAEPHTGMGVQYYGWFTSPLRRAADYVNQQQLISLLHSDATPRFAPNDADLYVEVRDFDAVYNAYHDFQREMESYWSLVYLQQQNISELTALVLKEDLVRIHGLPLVSRATGIPIDIPAKTTVKLRITELNPEKRLLSLNYLAAVVDAV